MRVWIAAGALAVLVTVVVYSFLRPQAGPAPEAAPIVEVVTPPARTEVLGPAQLISSNPVAPYPDAVEVRLFVRRERVSGEIPYLEPEGRRLSPAQRMAFERSLTAETWREGLDDEVAACFVPHHFFRYFDGAGQQVGEIAVCLCCHGVRASPSLALEVMGDGDFVELNFDEPAVRGLVEELDLPTDIHCDY